jgi:hypothetical protein
MSTKHPSKRKSWKVIGKLMEKMLDLVNQKEQDKLKKFQETTKKNLRRHRKLNELREDFKNIKVKQRTI